MTMHGKVECRPAGRARTLAAGHVLLAAAGLLLWKLSAGGSDSTFVEGISKVVSGETRQVQVHMQSLKIPVEKKYRFEGTTRAKYLKRLRHRRWCAQFTYPRTFGYVLKWNDTAGEGVVIDQEQTQKYLVIRDEIGSSYHAHKTLQPAEFVEFFATDEMDEVSNMPMAKNVTGPHGNFLKTNRDYRELMLRSGTFPKRWEDTYDEYEKKVGEWWTQPKWKCGFGVK
eukprot:CAMPEP_0181430900 /NCGR_PEP_ID=MMETSP1110-20121109/17963_1 /TAXON_ID=174948 /ORGANISM="Symbiodinium sp., Strain CCMP421" /LENGTH=225 /DNA_ID=CAMNT_0023554233 /DNA_START=40 /DNA_END=717 /DNA_ORIENTATION=-